MSIKNTEFHYGSVAMMLHWLIAALIIGLIILGLYMESLPDVGFSSKKITLILLHKQLGVLTLGLVIIRLVWTLINVVPSLASSIQEWQIIAAYVVHIILYIFMFALPISGWLMSSAAGLPVTFFGWLTMPNLIAINEYKMQFYISVHSWLGYGMIFLIGIHTGAALIHHFFDKDDTLKRMLP